MEQSNYSPCLAPFRTNSWKGSRVLFSPPYPTEDVTLPCGSSEDIPLPVTRLLGSAKDIAPSPCSTEHVTLLLFSTEVIATPSGFKEGVTPSPIFALDVAPPSSTLDFTRCSCFAVDFVCFLALPWLSCHPLAPLRSLLCLNTWLRASLFLSAPPGVVLILDFFRQGTAISGQTFCLVAQVPWDYRLCFGSHTLEGDSVILVTKSAPDYTTHHPLHIK